MDPSEEVINLLQTYSRQQMEHHVVNQELQAITARLVATLQDLSISADGTTSPEGHVKFLQMLIKYVKELTNRTSAYASTLQAITEQMKGDLDEI